MGILPDGAIIVAINISKLTYWSDMQMRVIIIINITMTS